ncbi:unnamed protein product [Ectocarpus sp. CCAP 1310/34]|nr:unnamed protein product [Ectocarpus sp. CCAP 1310/34]
MADRAPLGGTAASSGAAAGAGVPSSRPRLPLSARTVAAELPHSPATGRTVTAVGGADRGSGSNSSDSDGRPDRSSSHKGSRSESSRSRKHKRSRQRSPSPSPSDSSSGSGSSSSDSDRDSDPDPSRPAPRDRRPRPRSISPDYAHRPRKQSRRRSHTLAPSGYGGAVPSYEEWPAVRDPRALRWADSGRGDQPCPVYGGPSSGPLTIANSAVMLQDKVMSVLRNVESGKMRLEPDVYVDGRFVTVADEFTPRRVELISDLVQEYSPVSQQIAKTDHVHVYLINGEVITKPHREVTATDWLRLDVREHALTGVAAELACSAFSALTLTPEDGWSAAAARILSVFRATRADPERPYMTEQALFWRFATPVALIELYDRVVEVLLPTPFDRNGVSAKLHGIAYETTSSLGPLRMEWHDLLEEAMARRGVTAEKFFRKFVGVLSARNASYITPPAPRKHAKVAAYQNQTATAPGGHGVPFEARSSTHRPAPSAPAAGAAPAPALTTSTPNDTRPPPSASRIEIIDYLRSHDVCYHHAFLGTCRRSPCRWNKELVPPALYKEVSSRQGAGRGKHLVASLSPGQYSLMCEFGILSEGSDDEQADDGAAPAVDQLWVAGQIWHRHRRRRPRKVEILLDAGTGGGSYISLSLWRGLKRLIRRRLDESRAGALEAANPRDIDTPPMRILGSVALPVLFDSDARVRDVEVHVVDGLPYGFIVGADFFRRNASVLDFSSSRGFRPVPAPPWVPLLSIAPYASNAASPLRNARDQFSILTAPLENAPEVPAVPTDVPSYEDVVWEDDTSFEWDVRQVPETAVVEGFTTRAVEATAVGPQPQDRQLVMVLPTERLDLEQGAVVGVARADANLGTLGSLKQQQLGNVLAAFIEDGLFPIDPKRVPACINGELELLLINEFCTPFAAKQRLFSPEERRIIRAENQQLEDRGVIRQSMSPWAAQCLCVKKKDDTLRLCIDWRELNKLLVSDSGGFGDMQTIFDGLKGKKWKPPRKTVTRRPFEMRMECFGNLLARVSALEHLSGVFSWLDDILIASDTWEEHLVTLTLVLNRLLAAGRSVNFAKCIFGAASQEFLGMIIESTDLYPAPSKLDTIARMPRPLTVKELRTFLGLSGYLPEEVAFQSLRETLASPKVLAYPDLERPFELHTDASTLRVGASLMQTIDGVTRAVAFASHRFSQTDARRGPTERECMGALWAVDHFRPWALRLMEYDMELEWKAGVENVVPDALSRLPVANPVEVDVDDSIPDDLLSPAAGASVEILGPELDGRRTRIPSVRLRPIDDAQLPPTSVLEAIPDREAIGPTTVESSAPAPAPSTLPPSPVRPGHDDIGEVLAARGEFPTSSSSQAIGGASAIDLTARVLTRPSELAHRQRDDTHLGQVRKVLSNGADSSRGGSGCDRRKRPLSRRVAMVAGRPLEPWDELQMDILKIDTPSQTGNNYILLVVDRASKFPIGFPLETKQAVGVARVVVELCLTYGVPKTVRCDGGPEFGAEVVKHLCRWLRANIVFGAADHPRGQGSVERLGGWLQEMLAKLCRSWSDRWDVFVSPAMWIKRTLPDTSLPSNMTPFEFLNGDSTASWRGASKISVKYDSPSRNGMNELRVAARAKANASIERSSAGVGDVKDSLVLVGESESSRHRDHRGRELQHDLYTGPWKVTGVVQPGLSVEVMMHGRKKRSRRVSTADVNPFHLR